MKLPLILITWFNGFLADSAPSQETKSETLVDLQTLEEHPAKKAA
jgi:hypothetical protein